MNKKIRGLTWQDDELRIIAKNAGKLPISEIVILVNEVSRVVRTENAIQRAGNVRGFEFKVAA